MKIYIQKEELEQGINDLLLKCLDNDNLSQQYSMGYIGAITNVIGLIERLAKDVAVKNNAVKSFPNGYISCLKCGTVFDVGKDYCPGCKQPRHY